MFRKIIHEQKYRFCSAQKQTTTQKHDADDAVKSSTGIVAGQNLQATPSALWRTVARVLTVTICNRCPDRGAMHKTPQQPTLSIGFSSCLMQKRSVPSVPCCIASILHTCQYCFPPPFQCASQTRNIYFSPAIIQSLYSARHATNQAVGKEALTTAVDNNYAQLNQQVQIKATSIPVTSHEQLHSCSDTGNHPGKAGTP